MNDNDSDYAPEMESSDDEVEIFTPKKLTM